MLCHNSIGYYLKISSFATNIMAQSRLQKTGRGINHKQKHFR